MALGQTACHPTSLRNSNDMRVDIQFYSHSISSQVCKHQPPVVQEMVRDTCWLLLPLCSPGSVYGQKSPESSYRLVNIFCEQCIGWLVADSSAPSNNGRAGHAPAASSVQSGDGPALSLVYCMIAGWCLHNGAVGNVQRKVCWSPTLSQINMVIMVYSTVSDCIYLALLHGWPALTCKYVAFWG